MGGLLRRHTCSIFSRFKRDECARVQINAPKEAKLKPGKVWKPLVPIYGFYDAPRNFYMSLLAEIKKRGGGPHPLDPAYFVCRDKHSGKGGRSDPCIGSRSGSVNIVGQLKVDLEFAGEDNWVDNWIKDIWESLRLIYKIPLDEVRCAYNSSYKMAGTWVYQNKDSSIRTNQEPYISTLEGMNKDTEDQAIERLTD